MTFRRRQVLDGSPDRAAPGLHRSRVLFEAGRNVKQVSEWLGHADRAFTLRIYIHLIDAGVGDADFLDEAVEGGNGVATQHPETAANPEPVESPKTAD